MVTLRLDALGQRARMALAAIIASGTLLALPVAAAEEQRVIGSWRFTAPLDSSEVAALDEKEAQQLVGHVFTISKSAVRFGSRECAAPSLETERVEPRLYLREQAHASAEHLHLPNPVTVVELGCTVAFIKNADRLVIHWKGWFFDAVRLKPAGPHRIKRKAAG